MREPWLLLQYWQKLSKPKKYSFYHFSQICLKNMVIMVAIAENLMKVIFDLSWVHCFWWRLVLEFQQWGYFAVVIISSCPRRWLMSERNHRRIIWHRELSWTEITKKTIRIKFLFDIECTRVRWLWTRTKWTPVSMFTPRSVHRTLLWTFW